MMPERDICFLHRLWGHEIFPYIDHPNCHEVIHKHKVNRTYAFMVQNSFEEGFSGLIYSSMAWRA